MKVLYGTGNPAKLEVMRRKLKELDIEIIGLCDLNQEIPDAPEDGVTPLENARQKAMCYFKAFGIPVFSCDSGLYIEGVPEGLQPSVHVRTVQGKYLNDEEMQRYYGGLAEEYGDLTARYRNAICLIVEDGVVYEAMEESMASEPFIITSKPHPIRKKGFPLDSLSIHIATGKYYYDMESDELDEVAVKDGFLEFFRNHLDHLESYIHPDKKELEVRFYDSADDSNIAYAVIIARTGGKWVFCKHKDRSTLEVPGGHREPDEDIDETARRELQEETGAIQFQIKPICIYSVTGKSRLNKNGEESFGKLYYAEITSFEEELHSEMEKVVFTEDLPENWTYPLIQPRLLEKAVELGFV